MKGFSGPANDLFAVLSQQIENEPQASIVIAVAQGLTEQLTRSGRQERFELLRIGPLGPALNDQEGVEKIQIGKLSVMTLNLHQRAERCGNLHAPIVEG